MPQQRGLRLDDLFTVALTLLAHQRPASVQTTRARGHDMLSNMVEALCMLHPGGKDPPLREASICLIPGR